MLLKTEKLGVNILQSVQSPTHLSHITFSQPFRIKCERYIFLKKCVRSSLLLILFPHVYVYSCKCIMVVTMQRREGEGINALCSFITESLGGGIDSRKEIDLCLLRYNYSL